MCKFLSTRVGSELRASIVIERKFLSTCVKSELRASVTLSLLPIGSFPTRVSFRACTLVQLVGRLSGGFTPCRHLRPSSGREHTIVTYSVR